MLENKKFIGEAGSFLSLLHLLSRGHEGTILISGMIDCANYEFHLSNNQFLQGKDNKSGLKFTFKSFSATAVTLGYSSGLRDICLDITTEVASTQHNHAGIVVDGCLVKMENVSIFLNVADDKIDSDRYYPALYLRHRAEVIGFLKISTTGLLAVAISGNMSATATVEIKGNLCVGVNNCVKPVISKCQIEVVDGEFEYSNLCINPAKEEFADAYVLMIGQTKIITKCLARPVISVFDLYRKQTRIELFHKQLNSKKTLLQRCLSFWD